VLFVELKGRSVSCMTLRDATAKMQKVHNNPMLCSTVLKKIQVYAEYPEMMLQVARDKTGVICNLCPTQVTILKTLQMYT
jgi:hypothetical protein